MVNQQIEKRAEEEDERQEINCRKRAAAHHCIAIHCQGIEGELKLKRAINQDR